MIFYPCVVGFLEPNKFKKYSYICEFSSQNVVKALFCLSSKRPVSDKLHCLLDVDATGVLIKYFVVFLICSAVTFVGRIYFLQNKDLLNEVTDEVIPCFA